MEDRYIGLCALFQGIGTASKLLHKSEGEIKHLISKINYENIPCLSSLSEVLRKMISNLSLERAAEIFNISPFALEFITSQSVKAPSLQINFEENTSECVAQLKKRVGRLYENGVKPKIIQNLFDLPNIYMIHSWFDWNKMSGSKGKKNSYLKYKIQVLRREGKTDDEIAKELLIGKHRIGEVSGDLERYAIIYGQNEIKTVLKMHEKTKNKEKLAKKIGVPERTVIRWFKNKAEGLRYSKGGIIESDEEGDTMTKFLALEKHYLNGGIKTNDLGDKVIKWINNFESKTQEDIGNPNKRQKTTEEEKIE
ncbi:unnamed protein product [Blepharisma stoltei]|uniref:Uncharacterized protein n=1 Tax=Blepharisma stoltei TaxID=1481888 RepID=A0AAU9JF05_9CILI|nr:unnamed protein product [Blepharisma stoltei]